MTMATKALLSFAVIGAGQLVSGAAASASAPELIRVLAKSYKDVLPSKSMTTPCPRSHPRVVGGGGSVNDGSARKVMLTELRPRSSFNAPDSFVASAQARRDFSGEWTLTAYAICGKRLPGRVVPAPALSPPGSPAFLALAQRCPPGKKALSAGARVLNADRNVGLQLVRASGPLDITRATAREQALPHKPSSANWQLEAYAVCAPPVPHWGASGVFTGVFRKTVVCPQGKRVLGVGGGGALSDTGSAFLQAVQPSHDLRSATVAMSGVLRQGMVVQVICA